MKSRAGDGEKAELGEGTTCTKYLLSLFIVLFFMMGAAILGVSLWIVIDRDYFSIISGNMLFSAGAYMLVAGGALMVFLSILGCCGIIFQNLCMLLTFGIFVTILFLVVLIGSALAGIYRTQLSESVERHMEDTLRLYYGTETHIQYNRAITEAWDKVQSGITCCAVQDRGWGIYKNSYWFIRNTGEIGKTKPFVPQSCCVLSSDGSYVDKTSCQFSTNKPPGEENSTPNPALHYRGCFSSGVEFIQRHSDLILGLGISVAAVMVSGICLSFCFYYRLSKDSGPVY